jgi:hypothetical protein
VEKIKINKKNYLSRRFIGFNPECELTINDFEAQFDLLEKIQNSRNLQILNETTFYEINLGKIRMFPMLEITGTLENGTSRYIEINFPKMIEYELDLLTSLNDRPKLDDILIFADEIQKKLQKNDPIKKIYLSRESFKLRLHFFSY